MTTALIYAVGLLLAALLSGLASRTVLSTSVLFILFGVVSGPGMLGWVNLHEGDETVALFSRLALFAVLYADGMRIGGHELRAAWRLPARMLGIGLPATFAAISGLAVVAIGLPWPDALLVAAVLTPTDPVFAAALIGRDSVSHTLRRLLNVESGLNDGLALPLVLGLLAWMGAEANSVPRLLAEVAGGVALGIAVPWCCNFVRVRAVPDMDDTYVPIFAVAVGVLVFTLARLAGVNEFLAAFSAGSMLVTLCQDLVDRFHAFTEQIAELLKLAALLAFGALIVPSDALRFGWGVWLFTFAVLFLARPLCVEMALWRSDMPWRTRLAAAWFGPKGFASVIYAIIVVQAGVPQGDELFRVISLVVVVSIVLHSSTDVLVANWLERAHATATNR